MAQGFPAGTYYLFIPAWWSQKVWFSSWLCQFLALWPWTPAWCPLNFRFITWRLGEVYYLPIPVLRKNPQPVGLHGSALGAVEATAELTCDWKNTKTCSLKSEKTFECISLRPLSSGGNEYLQTWGWHFEFLFKKKNPCIKDKVILPFPVFHVWQDLLTALVHVTTLSSVRQWVVPLQWIFNELQGRPAMETALVPPGAASPRLRNPQWHVGQERPKLGFFSMAF